MPNSFIQIIRITKEESGLNGKNLQINYQFSTSLIGQLLIASTNKGICQLAIVNNEDEALESLKKEFPSAKIVHQPNQAFLNMMDLLKENTASETIALHVKGTEFQLKVWAALLEIPFGELSNYGKIAQQIGHSKASRAVGTAIGSNPIALLIPCHRVVQASGKLGGFKWGLERKAAIIAWEASYQD
jgi:AraC family transcriptional regulator of adaptative response/methylated-DNA-[protein]-cysteine methyltransferase